MYVYNDRVEGFAQGSGTVYKFNAAGEPASFLAHANASEDTNAIEGVGIAFGGATQELAFDSSAGHGSGDLYAADGPFSGGMVDIFDSVSGAKLGELNSGVTALGLGARGGAREYRAESEASYGEIEGS